jgi:hypothetical protein
MVNRKYGAAAAILMLMSVSVLAARKPNLSGTWTLDLSRSDYGVMQAQAPQKLERTIVHEDPSLKFTTRQTGARGEVTTEMSYTTDGKPSVNRTPRGEVTGIAKWDGNVLVISSKREINGAEITQNERWSLSGDGKTLTILNKISMPAGESEIRLVLDKK